MDYNPADIMRTAGPRKARDATEPGYPELAAFVAAALREAFGEADAKSIFRLLGAVAVEHTCPRVQLQIVNLKELSTRALVVVAEPVDAPPQTPERLAEILALGRELAKRGGQ